MLDPIRYSDQLSLPRDADAGHLELLLLPPSLCHVWKICHQARLVRRWYHSFGRQGWIASSIPCFRACYSGRNKCHHIIRPSSKTLWIRCLDELVRSSEGSASSAQQHCLVIKFIWCGGWDSNPRRPSPQGPKPQAGAFQLPTAHLTWLWYPRVMVLRAGVSAANDRF